MKPVRWWRFESGESRSTVVAKLARLLRLNRRAALGLLVEITDWCAQYAPAGVVEVFDDLCDGIGWDGDRAALREALLECGTLTKMKRGEALRLAAANARFGRALSERDRIRAARAVTIGALKDEELEGDLTADSTQSDRGLNASTAHSAPYINSYIYRESNSNRDNLPRTINSTSTASTSTRAVRTALAIFSRVYREETGGEYLFVPGKDAVLARRALEACGSPEAWEEIVRAFVELRRTDPYYRRLSFTLGAVAAAAHLNDIRARLAKRVKRVARAERARKRFRTGDILIIWSAPPFITWNGLDADEWDETEWAARAARLDDDERRIAWNLRERATSASLPVARPT